MFERRNGEWLILAGQLIRDHYPRPPAGEHGSQKETDPVRWLFGTLSGATPA